MRRFISVVLVLLLVEMGSCQTFRLSFEAGYGSYDMGKLHQAQNSAVTFYDGLGIKEVEKFPPFFNQNGSFLWYATPDFLVGITTGFLSTGARNSVADYSGNYKLDMLVSAYLYGLETEYDFRLRNHLKYFVNLRAGQISSTFELKENFVVSTTTLLNSTNTLMEKNLFMEPATGIRYCFNKSVSLSLGVGYLIDFAAYRNDKVTNWSGYQLKSGIAFSFWK